MKHTSRPFWLIVLLVVLDQCVKIYVKTHFLLGESVSVFGSWFKITFVENPGMAYGMTFLNKYVLTSFRVLFFGVILYFLAFCVRQSYKKGYVYILALVAAGALGNIIDGLFYGLIFGPSTPYAVAHLFPSGGGYTSFMLGKVVDMFYFPLFTWPSQMPFLGGQIFFSPVFNCADSYVSIAVVVLILFYSRTLSQSLDQFISKKGKHEV